MAKTTRKTSGSSKARFPVPPIKAPARNVKGIGKLGLFEGGLTPTVINPKYGPNGGKLDGQILGRQR
jgi:hypothetical protein